MHLGGVNATDREFPRVRDQGYESTPPRERDKDSPLVKWSYEEDFFFLLHDITKGVLCIISATGTPPWSPYFGFVCCNFDRKIMCGLWKRISNGECVLSLSTTFLLSSLRLLLIPCVPRTKRKDDPSCFSCSFLTQIFCNKQKILVIYIKKGRVKFI